GRSPERYEIVDISEIVWTQRLAIFSAWRACRADIGQRFYGYDFARFHVLREGADKIVLSLLAEIVQRVDSGHHWGEGGGDGGVGGVGDVLLAVDDVFVESGSKGLLYLASGAVELDDVAAIGDLSDFKPGGGQPADHGGHVGIGGAELRAEFLRRQPLMIAGGFLVLLILDEATHGRFLLIAAFQHQQHAVQWHAGRNFALIEGGASHGMDVAGKDGADGIIHRLGDQHWRFLSQQRAGDE